MEINELKLECQKILLRYENNQITDIGLVVFLMNKINPYLGLEEESLIDQYNIIGDLFALYEFYLYKSPALGLKNPKEIINRLLTNMGKFVGTT